MSATGRRVAATPFAAALDTALQSSELTLSELHARLTDAGESVSPASLSYWRSGARTPRSTQSLIVVDHIEQILGLPPTALSSLLHPPTHAGPQFSAQVPMDEQKMEHDIRDVYESFGVPYPRSARDVTTHSIADVSPDGVLIRRTTRALLQATIGSVDRLPILEITPGLRSPQPEFTVHAGGTIVATHSHPDGEVHGALVSLDKPITSGQTTIIEWSREVVAPWPQSHQSGHVLQHRSRELLLWVRFHPKALPAWIEEHVLTNHGTVVENLALTSASAVHRVHRDFGPGGVKLRWGFDD